MRIYSIEEYIIFSKINANNIEKGKNITSFTKLFLNSLSLKMNIFNECNYNWVIENSITDTLKDEIKNILFKNNLEILKREAKEEYRLCLKNNIKILTYEDENFPKGLKKLWEPSLIIYYQGSFPSDDMLKNATAVVGSRKIYPEFGGKLAEKIGMNLARRKKWNISGLALGIDTYAHKGSLTMGGYTGAFIAQGLLVEIYPKENLELKLEIIKNGGFVASEFPVYSSITKEKFILRNRLQVGLAEYLIVPEFNERGGTVSTIEFGIKKGIPVYICSPLKTITKNPAYKILNKGNAILSFKTAKLKELYPDFNELNFERLYKLKMENKYIVVEKIPKFSDKKIEQKKLF